MIDSIYKSFKSHPSLNLFEERLQRVKNVAVHGLCGSSSTFLAAFLLKEGEISQKRSILAVLPDEEEAEAFRDDAEILLGHDSVMYFPARDTNPYDFIESHFEVRSQRVETLDRLENGWKGIVVCSVLGLHDPSAPPGLISLESLEVHKADKVLFDDFVRNLSAKGFKRLNTVTDAGQMAVHGGIIDIFPFGGDTPYRIEFWGDEVESIRTFSTSTQRSLEQINSFRIIPPDECVTEAGITTQEESRLKHIEMELGIDLVEIRRAFNGGEKFDGMEQYLYIVFGSSASLVAHLSDTDIVFLFDPDRCRHEIESRMESASKIWERRRYETVNLPSIDYFYQSTEDLMNSLEQLHIVNNYSFKPKDKNFIEFNIKSSRQYQGDLKELKKDISNARSNGMKCHILCDNKGQVERLDELLDDIAGDYLIDVARLSGGFTDSVTGIMVCTDHEIFSRYRRKIRYRRFKEGVPIIDHRALTLGDYVVHVDHGIGKYIGLKRTKIGGAETDCLIVKYRNDDQLLLPIGQLERIKKYTAEEGVIPVISKLGGTSWMKLRERIKKSIHRMADELLRLYAERKAFPGFKFIPNEYMIRALEESFVYEETPDQYSAWKEVRNDMESTCPMERLICGDVGFGKTEIAMRAAFLAVQNSKQVSVLVPTTILAEQHEETFKERFADFPVKVESISRFKSQSEQLDILDRLAKGDIDIIIGTHRLISKDIYFKDIGLLIIDEEQRFGVRQKERLKKIRRNVDVLAMSATPIPRTLNMAISGARDISYINTPPRDRYSIHTEIVPFEEKFIIEAILKEIDRDGQVFFVHNRVKSIMGMADYLKHLLPEVTFGVAHGQLPEKRLEKIIRDFNHGEFQVLVSTMIIENGLDIPSVNTIIINRADTFGLSQLYQIRGRVGRSNRRAFAYLLIPPKTPLSKTARRRLKTIEEFAELGSGFKIAMRDLEIRGAGNILGTEQSGFISAVGFDLYMDLLRETIAELKGDKIERPPDVKVHIQRDAYFPETYIPDSSERVLFYRRLSESVSVDEVKAVEDELIDRFGRSNDMVMNLLNTAYIRHYAAAIGVSEVTFNNKEVNMYFPESIELKREKLEAIIKKSPVKLNFSFNNGMIVTFHSPKGINEPISGAKKVLQAICN